VLKVQSNVFTVGDKPIGTKLVFPFVRSEDGSIVDTLIMSFRSGRIVRSRLSGNKTRGYRTYLLFPANYVMYEVYRTNRGRASIKVSVIEVPPNPLKHYKVKDVWVMYEGVTPITFLEELPDNIRRIIEHNFEELPLYEYLETEVPK
jgi:hypothetical protein